ncbi:uncharacterized protein LOC124166473 [Ischnura elegans]|uniref:uncharacterized protein LOC124166473 n=1 Tax=Ischnura elegans TaxID=197161 RepID=UPI001ED86B40|nr:uncharacterized protein LOC124166473 [Ischnura elegans]
MTVAERKEVVQRNKLCLNCLRQNHLLPECHITSRCLICNEKHHTKLHLESPKTNLTQNSSSNNVKSSNSSQAGKLDETAAVFTSLVGKTVLLATARVVLKSNTGSAITVRALLDPAAERSFISESVANSLYLKRTKVNVSVTGVGGKVNAISHGSATLNLCSNIHTSFSLKIPVLILNKLTSVLPNREVTHNNWPHIQGLQLADPFYYKRLPIDCILGADVYDAVLRNGVKRGPRATPVAQETVLGWILTGQTAAGRPEVSSCHHIAAFQTTVQPDTSELLSRLWELEELPSQPRRLPEDDRCEQLYKETVYRNKEGRYVVKLPLFDTPHFPGSRDTALSTFLRAENRRQRKPTLNIAYIHFMEEYENLGHMVTVPHADAHKQSSYYMPHHEVVRTDGTQKIRVVFNASRSCTTGFSLNDFLKSGPKLQLDLPMLLTRWRMYKYVFSADIVKMFRQILVREDDADYQRIVWRSDPTKPIQDYKLTTVTYGTASAPYLAIRTLLQLAEDEEERYPKGSAILRTQTYVDDIFSGGNTIEDAILKRDQLIEILKSAGFPLGKWSSNHPTLLTGIHTALSNEKCIVYSDTVPTLGLKWSPEFDYFSFNVNWLTSTSIITKRTILSQVAKLFDPLGWLSPVVIAAKILLQDLWLSGIDWDSPVTGKLADDWIFLTKQLLALQELKIPRWLGVTNSEHWELHGFSDASERAYAATVYYLPKEGKARLIFAKAKVAPVKTVSLPRLELCGALLLARVISYILSEFSSKPLLIHCWTDSKVVLSWLKGHPSNWKTFVANRVSEILEKCPNAQWLHIKSSDNPADCATRGYTSEKLRESSLWWNGPQWISQDPTTWPLYNDCISLSTDIEQKSKVSLYTSTIDEPFIQYFERFSSFSKIIRILAYCGRWMLPVHERKLMWLTTAELAKAKTVLWRNVQHQHFKREIICVQKSQILPKGSALRRLSPFLCESGLLRVGGRLQYSTLPFEEKHPIILPKDSHFTKLLVEYAHITTLHGGPQLMLSYLNRFCWIIHGRRLVQRVFRNCIKCTRFVGQPLSQQMAPLPVERLTPRRPFSYTGLDYAGPIWLRTSKGRGSKSHKGYIVVFICLVTRAIHLEIVTDLTTDSFLAAYHRFTGRRGHCSILYSDNATTFRGAAKEINRLFAATSKLTAEVALQIAKEGTSWTFIPPRAPHFGGIWEAAVRSFKHHLKRVLGDNTLTYEELSTLLVQIEACLNSRPLTYINSELNDFVILTPGHFLIGSSLLAPPEPFMEDDLQKTFGSRWKQMACMRNSFWKTWRKDILHQMQQRNKWLKPIRNLREGDIVILKDELSPPTRWPIGRITKLHPGPDGLVRVATVKTATMELIRPIVKLIRLPTDAEAISFLSEPDLKKNLPLRRAVNPQRFFL